MGSFRYVGLELLERKAMSALKRGVRRSTDQLQDNIKQKTPTLTTALKSGIKDDGLQVTGRTVTTRTHTSGPSNEYAIYEHESTYYKHDDGERKFIERPLLGHGRAHAGHIARETRREF